MVAESNAQGSIDPCIYPPAARTRARSPVVRYTHGMNSLARLRIYPIKSLDPVELESCRVLPNGNLANDRRWAMVDAAGDFVNGKRNPAVHKLRAHIDLERERITLTAPDQAPVTFGWPTQQWNLEAWLSDYFEQPIRMREDRESGFPDDLQAPGPTIVSSATIREVASWFGWSDEACRLRFRANLEIEASEPFWEDRLYGPHGKTVPFRVGEARWHGTNACQRCVVPSRDPSTGAITPAFAKRFAERRSETLPVSAPRSCFDHFFRLAVNTRGAGVGDGRIRVGDPVALSPTGM